MQSLSRSCWFDRTYCTLLKEDVCNAMFPQRWCNKYFIWAHGKTETFDSMRYLPSDVMSIQPPPRHGNEWAFRILNSVWELYGHALVDAEQNHDCNNDYGQATTPTN